MGNSATLNRGEDTAIIALGKMVEVTHEVISELKEEKDIDITLINARFVKPLDEALLLDIANSHNTIITIEDNAKIGGFGSYINDLFIKNEYKGRVINIGIPDEFVEHGSVDTLYKELQMDKASIKQLVIDNLESKN